MIYLILGIFNLLVSYSFAVYGTYYVIRYAEDDEVVYGHCVLLGSLATWATSLYVIGQLYEIHFGTENFWSQLGLLGVVIAISLPHFTCISYGRKLARAGS